MASPAIQGQIPPTTSLPVPVQRYVLTGAAPSPLKRDAATALNQIPRWTYGLGAALAFWMAYKEYKLWKGKKGAPTNG